VVAVGLHRRCGPAAARSRPIHAVHRRGSNTAREANESGAKPRLAAHPFARESRVISELMSSAERVRNLRFTQPVPVLVEDRARITDYVSTQIEEDELERARIVYTALGLLPAELDVRSLLLRLMGEQVVGYYDPDHKHLVVRDDVMRSFAEAREHDEQNDLTEARIVLLHELVHALQDQNLQLFAHIHAERDTDASNAFHALVEGDATLAMIGYALEREQIPLHKLTGNPTQVRQWWVCCGRSCAFGAARVDRADSSSGTLCSTGRSHRRQTARTTRADCCRLRASARGYPG
jgi:hypothetical protein